MILNKAFLLMHLTLFPTNNPHLRMRINQSCLHSEELTPAVHQIDALSHILSFSFNDPFNL